MLLLLLLLELKDREVAALSWIQAADKLNLELGSANSEVLQRAGFNSSSDAISRFASARKITANTVRRQLAAATFLRELLSPDRYQDLVDNENPPFNTVEVLKKIYGFNPGLAVELLPSVLNKRLTFASISEKYQAVQSTVSPTTKRMAAKRDANIEFENEVCESLVLQPSVLYPGSAPPKIETLRRTKNGFAFALPDAIATYSLNGSTVHDGIEVRMPSDTARHQLWQILERLHLMSTFFTHTWLILPKPTSADREIFLTNLLSAKSSLGLPSVGVATAAAGESMTFEALIRPTGAPEIDRRHLFPAT